MSKQMLMKYGPGDEIEVLLEIQHVPPRLREVCAWFTPEGQGYEDARHIVYMCEKHPHPSAEEPPPGMAPDEKFSEVRMSAIVEPKLPPGVYRLNRVTLTTFGGKEHRYSGEELGNMNTDVPAFEIVEEPDDKPALRMTILRD